MSRATLIALVLASACYEPEAVDCTLSCRGEPDECADGQVCGSDGFCAAPDVAGHCNDEGGNGEPALVSLEIRIEGEGKIDVEDMGQCDSRTAPGDVCTFSVPPNVARELRANESDDRELAGWSGACAGETPTCTLIPVMDITRVGAKFE